MIDRSPGKAQLFADLPICQLQEPVHQKDIPEALGQNSQRVSQPVVLNEDHIAVHGEGCVFPRIEVIGRKRLAALLRQIAQDIEFDYINPNPIGGELTDFFQTVERKNWLDFDGVTFSEEDTVLTLSTCCRKYDKTNSGNQRLVVMAKLLPEGATAQEFSVSLVDSPEMP